MENSSLNSDSPQLDKARCWSLFYIDEDDNIMHDFGWKNDEDTITLAQLLMGIKYTQIIVQSLQMAYLDYLDNHPEEAYQISEIIEFIESNTDINPENTDYISPLFIDNKGDLNE